MGLPSLPKPVMLFVGVLASDPRLLDQVRPRLVAEFGPVAIEAGPWDWKFTDYYLDEMGPGLRRWFLAFEEFRPYEDLARIKLFTNELEAAFSRARAEGRTGRGLNLDPGFVDLARVILATTKEHAHRICLGRGIWADLTLTFAAGDWRPLPWTYPDYNTTEYRDFLTRARNYYKQNRNIPT